MGNREITKREFWGREVANFTIGVVYGIQEEKRKEYFRGVIEILENHRYIKRTKEDPKHPETRFQPKMTDVKNTETPEGLAGIIIDLLNPNYNADTSNKKLQVCLDKLRKYSKVF
ncbi:MAG: hypothetical protein KKF67_00715 [Nanoarchaeota archaeon]|nr:hypothetical protein [Nanoarchaeota archaeon]